MFITRVITDIPRNRVVFVTSMVEADNGRIVDEQDEPDGEVTLVAEFPGAAAAGAASASAAAPPAPASSVQPAAEAGSPEARCLAMARQELDVVEEEDEASNPRIERYHATTSGGAELDSVPWCSSFVNFCVEQAGLKGTDSKAARSWMNWGKSASAFVPGCIVVLQRGAAPKGHVGFFVGTEAGRLRILGGNQGNRVSIASFDADRVLARRVAG